MINILTCTELRSYGYKYFNFQSSLVEFLDNGSYSGSDIWKKGDQFITTNEFLDFNWVQDHPDMSHVLKMVHTNECKIHQIVGLFKITIIMRNYTKISCLKVKHNKFIDIIWTYRIMCSWSW